MDPNRQPKQFLRRRRPDLPETYCPLSELAELLPVPVEFFIALAVRGDAELGVRLPDRVAVFSVHEDAVDLDDPIVDQSKFLRKVPNPSSDESAPVPMAKQGIDAFLLTSADCLDVLRRRVIRKRLFARGMKCDGPYWATIDPVARGYFTKAKTLSDSGWSLACYPVDTDIPFSATSGYARPVGIEVSRDTVFATTQSVERLLNDIDVHRYVKDLLADGDVVVERPKYFSEKLNYVLDTGEKYWRSFVRGLSAPGEDRQLETSTKRIAKEAERAIAVKVQIEKTEKYLSRLEFHQLCEKGQASKGLVEAATKFLVPTIVREPAEEILNAIYDSYITPEMLALMAGARYFWGDVVVDQKTENQRPDRGDVVHFFQYMGFKGNDAKYAATLISLAADDRSGQEASGDH